MDKDVQNMLCLTVLYYEKNIGEKRILDGEERY